MKIALVCPYDWARPGGVRAHVAALADRLVADHDVRILAPASEQVDDRRVIVVGGAVGIRFNQSVAPVAVSPLTGRRVVRVLEEFDPHVVHVHEPLVPFVSLAGVRSDLPTVGTFHAWSAARFAYRTIAPFGRRVAKRLDALVAVSPAAREYAAGALKLPLGSFRLLPNGVEVARFASAEPLPHLADPDRPLLLFVGRLEPRKGLDVLIRAFLRLRASIPHLRLCVVGDGPERDRCQQMIPPSLRPDVLFVGRVSEQDLPRYLASAQVFVSPAVGGESFGIVLLEAMAAGLPVVASDIPGYRTVMKDGHQGRLVRPHDAMALAEALGALLANERLRTAMAAQGRSSADEYDWAVVVDQVVAVYREVRRGRQHRR